MNRLSRPIRFDVDGPYHRRWPTSMKATAVAVLCIFVALVFW